MKFNPEVFNEEFFTHPEHNRSVIRHERKYPEMLKGFENKSVQIMGCGRGWGVKILKEHGFKCIGFDVSRWAVENRVDDDVYLHNLLDPIPHRADISICINVLAYLPLEKIEQALKNIKEATNELVILRVSAKDEQENADKALGKPLASQYRLIKKPYEWWLELFRKYFKEIKSDYGGITRLFWGRVM